jgi:hypothetical protein
MTAATLRQTATPHVTVKSNIHMADDPLDCWARAPTPGMAFGSLEPAYGGIIKPPTEILAPLAADAENFFSFAFRRAIQHADA